MLILSVLILSALLMLVGLYQYKWAQYAQVLDDLEPRIARLQGLLEARDAIQEALQQASQDVSRLAYPASVDASRAVSDLQSKVRDALAAAGLEVVGSQAMPPRNKGVTEEFVLMISARGGLVQLHAGLRALALLAPRVRVELAQLAPVNNMGARGGAVAGTEPQLLGVQLRLVAVRLLEP
jgi:general secretion pathway protein M